VTPVAHAGRLAAALLVLALAAPAAAQSSRYPPSPPDPDAEAEARSDFWDRAVSPGLDRFRELVDRARRLIESRSPEHLIAAEHLLVEATTLLPDRAEGHWLLGVDRELRHQWSGCAASYRRVWELEPGYTPRDGVRVLGSLGHALGVCLARAGDLAEAAQHLERLTRLDDARPEVLLRLGEVYMAMGRLADAIEVLERAHGLARSYDVEWARAVAYDRARRPADAARAAGDAIAADRHWQVASPGIPYAPAGDLYFYLGVATEAKGEPEKALLYFRAYVLAAPSSPWRPRAVEHLDALEELDLSERVTIEPATADLRGATAAVRAAQAAFGRCVQQSPGMLAYVRITQVAARPPARAGELRINPPTPGVRASVFAAFATPDQEVEEAVGCLEREAGRLHLPRPSGSDRWSTVTFPVIAR